MKPLSILLIGGAGYALARLWQTKNAGDELAVSIGEVAVTKIQNAALTGWAEVWYDNFTALPLHIMQPTVKIFLDDNTTEIGHAIPTSDITDVPAHGRNITPATLHLVIPLSNIAFAIPTLLAGGKVNRKIIIHVETVFNGIPYKADKTYTI